MIVLCDIDGVIADPCELVKKYLSGPKKDWKSYWAHSPEILKVYEVSMLVDSLVQANHRVIFQTGRSESNRTYTEQFIRESIGHLSKVSPDILIMRREHDFRPGYVLKLENCQKYNPDLVLDDEPETVQALTKAGYTVLQVHGHRIMNEQEDRIPA